jgi:hypothetical protein
MRAHEFMFEDTVPEKIPTVLYHGTQQQYVEAIMREGLTSKSDNSWKEFGEGVYLSDSQEVARNYGPIVIAVNVSQLHTGSLRPDDDDLADYFETRSDPDYKYSDEELDPDGPQGIYECDWLDSLRLVQQCQYLGDIPPTALTVENVRA